MCMLMFVCSLRVCGCVWSMGIGGRKWSEQRRREKKKKNKKSWIEKIFLSHFLAFLVEFVYNWLSLAETPYQHT